LVTVSFYWYCVADAYGNLVDDSQWRHQDSDGSDAEPKRNDSTKIEKFRDLIRCLRDDKPDQENNAEFEMEVTWDPGTNFFVCNCMTAVKILFVKEP